MSNIDWTDQTCKPFVGCSNISGCDQYYANTTADRFKFRHHHSLATLMDRAGNLNRAPRQVLDKALRICDDNTAYVIGDISDGPGIYEKSNHALTCGSGE